MFLQNPQFIYAVFLIFILANLFMLPLGWAAIKSAKQILRVPRNVLMPIILVFAIVGSYAINNSLFDVGVMLAFAGAISGFVEKHPTVKMLALAFLVLIGVNLIAEGMGQHIEKAYTYFAMGFAVAVEMLNIRITKKGVKPVELRGVPHQDSPGS